MRKIVVVFVALVMSFQALVSAGTGKYLDLSKNVLELIHQYYRTDENPFLFNETYPFNPKNTATYTVSQDTISKRRVAYLWPTSGVLSGVAALLRITGNESYKMMLDKQVLPGIEQYYDTVRQPECYQSYLTIEGFSDRFYDDNVWLVIDFADIYLATKDKNYLQKAENVWKFVISGWDDQLGGGIYWCEQRKESKNACSNAPSVVAAAKLYEITGNKAYLNWAKRIYNWTKKNLQDRTDHLYYDNIKLNGQVDRKKYAYNSGQMLQGAALLYNITGEKIYLEDAQKIARSAISFFSEVQKRDGMLHRVFRDKGAWFVTVMARGYFELYKIDHNPEYINFFKLNMEYLQRYARYDNGLFYGDWSGQKTSEFRWLLDQGCIVELSANLSAF